MVTAGDSFMSRREMNVYRLPCITSQSLPCSCDRTSVVLQAMCDEFLMSELSFALWIYRYTSLVDECILISQGAWATVLMLLQRMDGNNRAIRFHLSSHAKIRFVAVRPCEDCCFATLRAVNRYCLLDEWSCLPNRWDFRCDEAILLVCSNLSRD